MLTIRTFNSSEPQTEVTALEVLTHYMRYHRPKKTVLMLEEFFIGLLKINKVEVQEFPKGGFLKSPAMHRIFQIMPDIARSESNVLILGEAAPARSLLQTASTMAPPETTNPLLW